jgi:ribosomal-protein-alanine N-acetyltransferase
MGGGTWAPADAVKVVLRPANGDDLNSISVIERLAFSDPWSEASFAGLLSGQRVRLTVAEADHAVVGYSVLLLAAPDADLANLAVAPAARGHGIGRRLLDGVVATAQSSGVEHMYLEVRQSNTRAIALYESVGFRPFSVRRKYYREPVEDAHVLRLALPRD